MGVLLVEQDSALPQNRWKRDAFGGKGSDHSFAYEIRHANAVMIGGGTNGRSAAYGQPDGQGFRIKTIH